MDLTQHYPSKGLRVRRILSGVFGSILAIGVALNVRDLAEQAYYEYYLFPRVKEAYIRPTRWQDLVALVALWGATIVLAYVAYRLLRYALRARTRQGTSE